MITTTVPVSILNQIPGSVYSLCLLLDSYAPSIQVICVNTLNAVAGVCSSALATFALPANTTCEVVLQASLEQMPGSYPCPHTSREITALDAEGLPLWLKRKPIFIAAYNSLADDALARTSKKAFHNHFYRFCEDCQYNVFSFNHSDRCHPQPKVLVQATIPPPAPLSQFTRTDRDDVTNLSPGGMIQRIQRIRADVRFTEEKVDRMTNQLTLLRAELARLTSSLGNNTGNGNNSSGGATAGSSSLNFPDVTINPGTSTTGQNRDDPLGDGTFPMTLEGQIARILFNQRALFPGHGVLFQASIPTIYEAAAGGRAEIINNVLPAVRQLHTPVNNIAQTVGHIRTRQEEQFTTLNNSVGILPGLRGEIVNNVLPAIRAQNKPLDDIAQTVAHIRTRQEQLVIPPTQLPTNTAEILTTLMQRQVEQGRVIRQIMDFLNNTAPSSGGAIPPTQLNELLNLSRSTVTAMGIPQATLQETLSVADVDQVLAPTAEQKNTASIGEQLNELDQWTVKNVLSRPTLIGQATWSNQVRGTQLLTATFPNQWLNNAGQNVHFNNMLSMFTMMKADVVFRLVVNATPMYGGVLAMGFDFFSRLTDASPFGTQANPVLDTMTMSNMDPVYLDISNGTVIELKVPFAAVSQYLSRQHQQTSSQFMGRVTVLTMSTLFFPENAPDVQMRLYAYVQQPEVAILQAPTTTPFVVPQASIVKAITSFAHSYLPNMQEVYPLAMEEGYHVKREGTCRIEDVGHVYGIVDSFTWTTSGQLNTNLSTIPITPMVHTRQTVGTATIYRMPKIGHLARHYSYWNGTLEYKIEVACSATHTGKLQVIFLSGPDFDAANLQAEQNAHILLDVQNNHELEFSVPFASPTPWKPTYLFQPYGDLGLSSTGNIVIRAVEPIKTAMANNSSITVNVYVRAAKDFQLAVPRNGLSGQSTALQTIAQVSLTSLKVNQKMNSEDFNDLYKPLRRYSVMGPELRTTTGEAFVIPVRPINPNTTRGHPMSQIATGFAFWRGSLSFKIKLLSCSMNYFAFEVYHVPTAGIPAGLTGTAIGVPVPRERVNNRNFNGSFFGSQTFHGDVDKEWEITVPYYSMYDHLHLPLVNYTGGEDMSTKLPLLSTNNGCIVIRPIQSESDPFRRQYSVSISIAAGSDFTFVAPTAFPPITRREPGSFGNNTIVVAQASLEDTKPQAGLHDIREFFQKLNDAVNNVNNLSSVFHDDVGDSSKDYIVSILETTVVNLAKQAKLSLSGWLADMIPSVDWRLLASAFVTAGVLYISRDKSSLSKVILVALGALTSHKVFSALESFVKEQMDPQIRVQVGAGLDIQTITQLCCGVVAVLLNMDMKKGLSGLIKNLGELGKNLGGVKSGVEAIRIFSAFVSENVVPSLGDEDSVTIRSIMADSIQILEEVHMLNLEEMRVACFTQEAVKSRVLKCDGRLQELYRLALASTSSPAILNALNRAMTKMDKLRTEVMAYKGDDGYRIDPFHISLYGPPRIGKSAIMDKISDNLIAFNDLPTTNKTYSRSPENVYWDNYKGQTTVLFDDLGQIAAPAPPSDLSELISLKSNAPYMVHMASMAEKGTYFTSKFIVSSTNFKLYNDCSFVKSKDALHRRRDVLVEVIPNVIDPETGLMPSSEFEHSLDDDITSEGYAKFRILNSMTGEPTTEMMTFNQLMPILCEQSAVHLRKQQELVEKNTRSTQVSPIIQSIIAQREPTIPVIVVDGEPVVVDAEAQGLLDALPTAEARAQMMERWVAQFNNALHWYDYGALTSGLSSLSQFNIAQAIRTGTAAGLSRVEQRIYNLWKKSTVFQKKSADAFVQARDGINTVGAHFSSMWKDLSPTRKKYLSTALVSLGALAVGITLYSQWYRTTDPGQSNIPLEVFSEGSDDYKQKKRGPPSETVQIESGIDDFKTIRGKQRIMLESGIDDHKTLRGTRKIVLESARDFEEWSARNPGLIPYRFQFNEKDGNMVVEEHPLWNDFEEYCEEQGHKSRWTLPPNAPGYTGPTMLQNVYDFFGSVKSKILPESGIDDFKTARGARKILVEGDVSANPMTLDVPKSIMELSEADLVKALSQEHAINGRPTEEIPGETCNYTIIKADPQYTEDSQCVDFMRQKLSANVGFILHRKSGYRMRCLAVDDRFIILPKHFFLLGAANWEQGDLFSIWIRGVVYEQAFHRKNLELWPNRDLCLYLLSARVTGARSIMSAIADRATHASYRQNDGSLLSVNTEQGSIFFERHHLPVVTRMTEADHQRIQYPVGNATHILKGYSYSADTVNGDCGSVLLQHNTRQPRKVLGLHVAAQTGITRAFAELLVLEEIKEHMDALIKKTSYITTGSVLQTVDLAKQHSVMVQGTIPKQFENLNENIDIFGKVPNHMVKRTPEKTEIHPSPIQEHWDEKPKTEPAPLSVKDPRCLSGVDPLIFQVGGYGLKSKPFPPEHYDIIREHQISKYNKYEGYIGRRVLSATEAINGLEGIDYADAMNMNSAEGSFWNLSRPFWAHNKSWMFENTAEDGKRANYKINYESGLIQKIVHRLREAKQGRRVLSTSSECLKDERRPFKKTRPPPGMSEEDMKNFTPGTRSFTILPVDYNICVRMYFWDFAAMIMKNRGELSSQVGIDPCSIEWTGIIKRLLATSNKGFAGDYKNYDRQTPAEFMDLACDVINGWYNDGPVNAQIRKVLMGEAFDHLSIVRGVFIHIDKGLPSGFPLTVIVNGMNNETYKYMTWLHVAPPKLISLDCCDEHVDSIFYGDDNNHAISPVASPFFNMCTMGKFLEEHGVMLTDEAKNPWQTAQPLVDVESQSFLKRLFVKHPTNGLYLAPLEKRSIEDRLLWITDSKFMSPEELLKENITNSLRDAFHWGPGYFLELKTRIGKAISSAYPNPDDQRKLMADITYGGEELRWIQTCKYMDQMSSHPVLKDVFGF